MGKSSLVSNIVLSLNMEQLSENAISISEAASPLYFSLFSSFLSAKRLVLAEYG
jgi:hypothetical protein